MTSALVKLTVSPLPRPPPPHEEWSLSRPIYLKAYNTILEAGDHASEQVKANPFSEEAKDNAMHARVIGYLLLEVFNRRAILTEGPCASIAKQIESASREGLTAHDIVFGIGKWYFDCLLHTYRPATGKYPIPSLDPSGEPFETLEEMTRECMKTNGGKALVRDGFRCMLTGYFDRASVERSPALAQQCNDADCGVITVDACHILNEPTMQDIDHAMVSENSAGTNKMECAVGVMAILEHLGFESLANELLEAGGIHNLGNLLSLAQDAHAFFNKLELWFEGTDEPNHYAVCVARKWHENYLRLFKYLRVEGDRLCVTFSPGHMDTQPPSPQLLALHAACARVVHMSGAAEALDELHHDAEEMTVLALDGSSARLLDHPMSPFATIPEVV